MKRQDDIAREVERWLNDAVLGLNLCPFARRPVEAGQLRLHISAARDEQALLTDLLNELLQLDQTPADTLETTLLVIPDFLQDFTDFNQFLDLAEQLIDMQGYSGIYQLATFHPHYQFAGTAADDAENLTNCAPYPVLHLLREASIERALSMYSDPEGIPQRNIATVESLTPHQKTTLFPYARGVEIQPAAKPSE